MDVGKYFKVRKDTKKIAAMQMRSAIFGQYML
jgi:hypothetical protein